MPTLARSPSTPRTGAASPRAPLCSSPLVTAYVASLPSRDVVADGLRAVLPDAVAHRLVRGKNVLLSTAGYQVLRRYPRAGRRMLRRRAARLLPDGYPLDTHFAPAYDPERRFSGWLFTIARRRALDSLRSRRVTFDLQQAEELVGDDGRETAQRLADAAELRSALADLPAHEREVVSRDGMWIAVTRHTTVADHEVVETRSVRFRTIGDATGTGAVESTATTVEEVIAEVAATRITERGATRADDRISEAGMEDRKREGYF